VFIKGTSRTVSGSLSAFLGTVFQTISSWMTYRSGFSALPATCFDPHGVGAPAAYDVLAAR